MYSLNIIGYIPGQKTREFKQHMRQMSGLADDEILCIDVFQDIFHEDLYHVKITFKDKKSMFRYIKSENHAMISGSFKTLGMLRDEHLESIEDVKEEME